MKFGEREEIDDWSGRIHDIMDEMLSRSFVGFRDQGCWQPATNVYETRDRYYICVELAGMDADAIDVECVDNRHVKIRGVRDQPRPAGVPGPLSVHALEIDEGAFRREIDLPDPIDIDHIEAGHSKGYLWITIPKITPR